MEFGEGIYVIREQNYRCMEGWVLKMGCIQQYTLIYQPPYNPYTFDVRDTGWRRQSELCTVSTWVDIQEKGLKNDRYTLIYMSCIPKTGFV